MSEEANYVGVSSCFGQVANFFHPAFQDGGEDSAFVDRQSDADPVCNWSEVAFVNGQIDTQKSPRKHKQCDLLATNLPWAADYKSGVVHVDLHAVARSIAVGGLENA